MKAVFSKYIFQLTNSLFEDANRILKQSLQSEFYSKSEGKQNTCSKLTHSGPEMYNSSVWTSVPLRFTTGILISSDELKCFLFGFNVNNIYNFIVFRNDPNFISQYWKNMLDRLIYEK